jgi:hypothetical protein
MVMHGQTIQTVQKLLQLLVHAVEPVACSTHGVGAATLQTLHACAEAFSSSCILGAECLHQT